jgi:hypothetical protein
MTNNQLQLMCGCWSCSGNCQRNVDRQRKQEIGWSVIGNDNKDTEKKSCKKINN